MGCSRRVLRSPHALPHNATPSHCHATGDMSIEPRATKRPRLSCNSHHRAQATRRAGEGSGQPLCASIVRSSTHSPHAPRWSPTAHARARGWAGAALVAAGSVLGVVRKVRVRPQRRNCDVMIDGGSALLGPFCTHTSGLRRPIAMS